MCRACTHGRRTPWHPAPWHACLPCLMHTNVCHLNAGAQLGTAGAQAARGVYGRLCRVSAGSRRRWARLEAREWAVVSPRRASTSSFPCSFVCVQPFRGLGFGRPCLLRGCRPPTPASGPTATAGSCRCVRLRAGLCLWSSRGVLLSCVEFIRLFPRPRCVRCRPPCALHCALCIVWGCIPPASVPHRCRS